jgi:hypothetical protein
LILRITNFPPLVQLNKNFCWRNVFYKPRSIQVGPIRYWFTELWGLRNIVNTIDLTRMPKETTISFWCTSSSLFRFWLFSISWFWKWHVSINCVNVCVYAWTELFHSFVLHISGEFWFITLQSLPRPFLLTSPRFQDHKK